MVLRERIEFYISLIKSISYWNICNHVTAEKTYMTDDTFILGLGICSCRYLAGWRPAALSPKQTHNVILREESHGLPELDVTGHIGFNKLYFNERQCFRCRRISCASIWLPHIVGLG